MSNRGNCEITLANKEAAKRLAASETNTQIIEDTNHCTVILEDLNWTREEEWVEDNPDLVWVAMADDDCESANQVIVHLGWGDLYFGTHVRGFVVLEEYGEARNNGLEHALKLTGLFGKEESSTPAGPAVLVEGGIAESVGDIPTAIYDLDFLESETGTETLRTDALDLRHQIITNGHAAALPSTLARLDATLAKTTPINH